MPIDSRPRLTLARKLAPTVVAAASGALWGLAFGAKPWLLAPWFVLAPLVLLLGTRRAPWLGFVHGFATWVVAIPWIVPTLLTFGSLPKPLSWTCLALLSGYLALYPAAFAGVGARLWRSGSVAMAWVGLPSLWVVLEFVRGHLFGGFPWNPAAHAFLGIPGALPSAAWFGVHGVSFLVLFANVGIALAIRSRRFEPALLAVLGPLLIFGIAARAGQRLDALDPHEFGSEAVAASSEVGSRVAIVQPNIPNLAAWDAAAAQANYQKALGAARDACVPGALVVMPESAFWPYSYERDPVVRRDLDALAASGCGVLFNGDHEAPEGDYNSAYLVAPQAAPSRYDKRHLVPFGEYVPLANVFAWVGKVARNAGDFQAADQIVLLPWRGERIGMAICYEIAYPDETAALTQQGATLLATITNDAWYGDTAAPWQHLAAARFRAAENRRVVLRAAITGVSAMIGPDGSVRSQLGVLDEGTLRVIAFGRRDLTLYARAPWLPIALAAGFTLFVIIASSLQRRRSPQ